MKQKNKAFLYIIFLLSPLSLRYTSRISALSGLLKYCLFCLVFFGYFVKSTPLYSQEQVKKSTKIGLVLSGGGAKGLAHIGVLKVIEEAGIKIDYIGGTSMGAVIGGLYASGYSVQQIDSIFKATNFEYLIQDFIPRASKNFYEKRNDELYAISLPFQNLKIGIPAGLSKGMYNYNLLARLLHPVRHVRDFNQLKIPFLCIATDIESGKQVVLDNGYLPQAIHASAAFPSLYSPVEIDGKVLVDGGVVNNYPIDEIKKLGADIIIGVDVQEDLKDRTALIDATKIVVQITNLQMIENMKQKIGQTDIYIKPEVDSYGIISFNERLNIIKKGEEAAFSVYENLKAIGSSTPKKQENRKISDSLQLEKIDTSILKNYTRSYIIGKLGFKSGKKINYEDIKVGIDKLNATQNFGAIRYTLEPFNSGDNLNITLKENPIKTYLKFGLHYDNLFKSGVLINLTQKHSIFKNDVVLFDIILGDNFRYNFDYYIDNGFHWSFGLKSTYKRFNRNVVNDFSDGQILSQLNLKSINIDFSELINQAYVQTVSFQKFLLGIGVEQKFLRIKSETLNTTTPKLEDSNYFSAFANLKYDSLDNKHFPKKGWYFTGDFQSYLYSTDYTNQFNRFSIAKADIGIAKTFYKKATIKIQTEAGLPIGNRSLPFFNFTLGGYGFDKINNIKQFYGYDFLSLSGDSYIKSMVTLDYEIYKKNHVNFSANYASIGNSLFRTIDWISKPQHNGYAIGYGLETIIGPLEVKYTWSPELSKGFTWFTVGFWF